MRPFSANFAEVRNRSKYLLGSYLSCEIRWQINPAKLAEESFSHQRVQDTTGVSLKISKSARYYRRVPKDTTGVSLRSYIVTVIGIILVPIVGKG